MITINVTQEHIRHGKARKCGECPVALAIQSVVKPDIPVFVGYDHIHIGDPGTNGLIVFDTPRHVRYFAVQFDSDIAVTPFAFELDIPSDYLEKKDELDY